MYKRIFILVLVFLFVAAVSLIALPALIFFVILGLSLCVFAKLRKMPAKSLLMQVGMIVAATPVLVFLLASAAMAGLFGGN